MSYIFIAHVEEDAGIALEIVHNLEKAGYRTWCYEVDSVPGPSYLVRTGEAVAQSQAMVIVISPHSLGSSQVTKEVVRAHESAKPFIPILRDITHAEFQKRQPEWREAIGSATSIRIPSEGVIAILPLITDGLKSLGIQPGAKANAARIGRISSMLEEIKGHPPSQERRAAATVKPIEESKKSKSRKPLIIIATSVIVTAIVVVAVIFLGRGGNTGNGGGTDGLTPTTVLKPDLVIREITWSPVDFSVDERVFLNVVVANIGELQTGKFYVALFMDGKYIESQTVSGIEEGGLETVTVIWTAEPGNHTAKLITDYNMMIAEADESNNIKEAILPEARYADLFVQDITWSPQSPLSGNAVRFTATIGNEGTGIPANDFPVGWYIDGEGERASWLHPIPGGGISSVTQEFELTSGTHSIRVVVDDQYKVRESDETNNSKTVTLTIS